MPIERRRDCAPIEKARPEKESAVSHTWPSIEAVIPHRSPFCFVDEILNVRTTDGTFLLRLAREDPRLDTRGQLHPLLLVEALAQCAAAFHDVKLRSQSSAPAESGMLVQIDDAVFSRGPHGGERVYLHIRQTHALGPLMRLQGEARACGELLVRVVLSVRRGAHQESRRADDATPTGPNESCHA